MTSVAHAVPSSNAASSSTSASSLAQSSRLAKVTRWTGRILTGIPIAFLLFDGAIKVAGINAVTDAMPQLGWPVSLAAPLGVILLTCVVLYALPRTAFLGAILLTGYLGGAVATHLRVGNPLYSHILFPTYVGAMIWGGLFLRDARIRALIPFRRTNA